MTTLIKKNRLSNYIYSSIFLVLILLLSTPNFSVVIVLILFIVSLSYLIENRQSITLIKADYLFIIACASYFLAFIPIAIIDGSTLRYFDAPSRFLLSIPIYLLIRNMLVNQKLNFNALNKAIEYGAITGSMGALVIALYQVIIEGRPRVDGFLYSINFGYLACSLAFLGLVFYKGSSHKLINLLGFSAAIIATMLTLTRGAIFAIPVLLIMTLFFLYREIITAKKVLLFAVSISFISMLSYQFIPTFKQRIDYTTFEFKQIIQGDTAKSRSSGGRILLWGSAVEAFKSSPLIGETYHNREIISQRIYDHSKYKNRVLLAPRAHAHSQYFEILACAGLLGIFALFLYLMAPLVYYYYLFSKNKNNIFALCGFIFTTGICIFGLTEVLLAGNLISLYYAFMQALLIATAMSYHALTTQKSSQ
ncbi:O-antigen ligase family protein [Psychromonas sp.]|uniref:O-antigen ligase family protein n=1 Tax=Psychromonas sp. TaxID=1884585 RepID=UPI00356546F2